MTSRPRVFISYRRSVSSALANFIRAELTALNISVYLDERMVARGPLPELLRREIEACSIVVAVLGRQTLESSWVRQEIELAHLFGKETIPVFDEDFEPPTDAQSPAIAELLQRSGVRFHTTHGTYFGEAIRRLVTMITDVEPAPSGWHAPDVDLAALPTPVMSELIGRAEEIGSLQRFLADPEVSVVSVTGFGGNGKSALVDCFLNDIAPDYGRMHKVYGWHFFSQEEHGSSIASSSSFWENALRFFGFQGELPTNESEKARELLNLVRAQGTILVLDGVEPMQNPPHVNNGQLSDKAMQGFLTAIARDGLPNGGLVLLTSRQDVVELARFRRTRAIDLPMLDEASGVALLTRLGVRGPAAELRATVADYRGHPLSLILLGRMLVTDYGGDIVGRSAAELHGDAVEDNVGAILEYYGGAWEEDEPELLLMYLTSLFRRPMREAELDELKAQSVVGAPLRGLSAARIARAVSHLRGYGLIISRNGHYDTHALIRRYFSIRFRDRHPEEFAQAHDVLFEYFRKLPAEELPCDLDGMDPLYRAIYHGCMAGRYADALDIYWVRISRKGEFFSQKQLGAFSSDLTAIAAFFPDGWNEPVTADLTQEQRAFLLALASFELTAVGRLTEALRPRYTEITMFEALGDWRLVCGDLRNLVQILVPLGRLSEALRAAEKAVAAARRIETSSSPGAFSDQAKDRFLLVSAYTRQATVLHRMGRLDEARTLFGEAETLHGSTLDQSNGFYFGQLLLDTADDEPKLREALRHGEHCLSVATDRNNLGGMGSGHQLLAQAQRMLGELEEAQRHADAAVTFLRRGNRLDRMPPALIERARLHRARWLAGGDAHELDLCQADLDEADQLITFANMVLYGVDSDILRAHVLFDQGRAAQAQTLIRTKIATAISATRFHLRLPEVQALKARQA